jgi:transposase
MSKHKSEDLKMSAVNFYLKSDKTQEKIAEIFNCSVRTLLRWVDRYKNNGSTKNQSRQSISYKVKQKHVDYILSELKKNKTITLKELLEQTKNKFDDFNISLYHLARIIKNNYVSLKLARVRHEPLTRYGKDININNQITQFYKVIKHFDLNNIISIDESSISAFQRRNYCYNDVGKRCVIKTHSQEVFKKYTGIFAIMTSGCIGWELYQKGGIDSNRLIEFINKYINGKYKKKLIILDNASSHRNDEVKKVIQKYNYLLHSVPYQHYTNAIEGYFNVLKSKLNKVSGLTYIELLKNITNVVKSIDKQIYKNIFIGAYNKKDTYVKKSSSKKKRLNNYIK